MLDNSKALGTRMVGWWDVSYASLYLCCFSSSFPRPSRLRVLVSTAHRIPLRRESESTAVSLQIPFLLP